MHLNTVLRKPYNTVSSQKSGMFVRGLFCYVLDIVSSLKSMKQVKFWVKHFLPTNTIPLSGAKLMFSENTT